MIKEQRSRVEMILQVKKIGEDKMMLCCQVAVLKTSTWCHSENLGRIRLSLQAHLQTNLLTIFGNYLDNTPSFFRTLLAKFIRENSWKIMFHWIIAYNPQLGKLTTPEPIGIWTNPPNPRVPWFLGTFWNFLWNLWFGMEKAHCTLKQTPLNFTSPQTACTALKLPYKKNNKHHSLLSRKRRQ